MKEKTIVRKRLIRTTIVTVFIAIILLLSSIVTAIPTSESSTNENIKQENVASTDMEKPILDKVIKESNIDQKELSNPEIRGDIFYASNLHDDNNLVYFDSDIPGTFYVIAGSSATDFLAAGCFAEDIWYACEYDATSNSNIWTIDETDGTMVLIGASGAGLNGLAYDPTTTTMYGCDSTNLYTIDKSTGVATLVGPMGNAGGVMIGIACDNAGNMYGEDIGDDNLYSIDTGTGAATIIGSLGIDLNFAQDMAYDKGNDMLYCTGYKGSTAGGGALYSIDTTTGAATFIGDFPIGSMGCPSEVAGFAIPYDFIVPGHDVGVQNINSPISGNAGVITPEVAVKNYGNNSETDISVNMKIAKKNVSVALYEDFEGSWGPYGDNPPAGWTILDYGDESPPAWNNNDWNLYTYSGQGNIARVYWSPVENQDEWLISPTIDCTGMNNVYLEFWHYFNWYSAGSDEHGYVEGSIDNGSTWSYMLADFNGVDFGPEERIYLIPWANGESEVKIRFRYVASDDMYWYVDNFKVYNLGWESEYNETVVIDVGYNTTVDAILPDWTPSDLFGAEDIDIEYFVEAEISMDGDENPDNDYKSSEITLHYGLFHDVGITEIISPVEGMAQPSFDPEVVVENFGQNDENVEVNMQIMTFSGVASIFDEGFEGYVPQIDVFPPTGWTIESYGPGANWTQGTAHGGSSAFCDEVANLVQDEWLISPTIDCSGQTGVQLTFWHDFYYSTSSGDSFGEIYGSTDNGATWTQLIANYTATEIADKEYDISAWADGESQVKIRFRFYSTDDASAFDDWAIDDVFVESVVVDEIFPEESFDPEPFPPAGWEVYNVDGGDQWVRYGSTYPRTGAWAARCYYDPNNDDWLATKSYVVPGGGGNFSFWARIHSSSYAEPFEVYYSTTGNTISDFQSGTLLESVTFQTTTYQLFDYTSNMTSEAGNTVWFAIRYIGVNDFGLYVDDMTFPDGTTEGFEMTFPPAGWTVESYGPGTDWVQGTAHDGGSAFCDEVVDLEHDEWLITPTIDCTGKTDVHLTFWHDFYDSSSSGDSFGEIYGSTDNGATWTQLIANYTEYADNEIADKDFNISTWAAGESQVKIRYRFYSTNLTTAYDDWAIDDVWVGGTPILTTLLPNVGFDEVIPESGFPPAGWFQEDVVNMESGSDPNIWRAMDDTYATNPAVDPYNGDYCAIYDTGKLYPQGSMARLSTPAIDFASQGASLFNLKFMMYLSNYGSTYTDHIWVQVSTDNVSWTNITQINSYDVTNPGWVEQIVDLSAYSTEPVVHIGFFGVDGGYRDAIIDDVSLEVPSVSIEYNETVFVDVDAGGKGSVNVVLPTWYPGAWLTESNTTIEYLVQSSVHIDDDVNPDNDALSEYIDLEYPYMDDIGVTEITSPSSGMAQSFAPEIVIENFGQNDESGFDATVKIGSYAPVDGGRSLYDFESNDGGFVPTADWDPVGDWEYTNSYDVSNYVGGYVPPPTAHSGDGMWGTVIYDDYTNAGGTSFLTKTVDFSGVTGAALSFYSWSDINGYFDYGTVMVDGVELLRLDTPNPTEWTFEEVDLSAYDGMSIELSFDLYASTVVEKAGWYIDDLNINDVLTEFVEEYNETVFIGDTLGPGETMNVVFPEWTPDYLATGENGYISYDIIACTDLAGDEDEDNDCAAKGIVLDYIIDVGTVEITEPSVDEGEPGTYPIEAIVKNYGTYTEDFSTSAKITKLSAAKIDELVYYDEIIVNGLAPDTEQTIAFDDWIVTEPSDYRIEVETQRLSDINPENNLKTKTILIFLSDTEPPETTHEISGTIGDENWYVSDVTIALTATDEGSGVANTYYSFDSDTGPWEEYTALIVVDEDGYFDFWYYSDDNDGNVEDVNGPYSFKRDATPPTIDLTWDEENTLLIADVEDVTSGIAKVEFYVNDEFLGEVTSAPYEWEYTEASSGDIAQAIAYDNAGNSKISDPVEAASLQSQSNPVWRVVQQNDL